MGGRQGARACVFVSEVGELGNPCRLKEAIQAQYRSKLIEQEVSRILEVMGQWHEWRDLS